MESEQQSAGAEDTTQGQEEGTPAGMQHLAELLAEGEQENQEKPGGDEDQESGSDGKTDLVKFNDLAGKLGMDLDALYKLQVSSSDDGELVTIEELKDLHKSRDEFELSKLEHEERRTQEEQSLMRAKAELQEIMQMLPEKAIKPEVLERIREKTAKQTALEREKTLQVIPEWKDAKVREADITGMADHLQGYGFPINYLANVVNHQQLRYIRDNWQREQRVRKALEQVRAGKPGKTPASKTQRKAPLKTPASSVPRGSARNKLEAVFSNLPE
jgi:hypothetical protein